VALKKINSVCQSSKILKIFACGAEKGINLSAKWKKSAGLREFIEYG